MNSLQPFELNQKYDELKSYFTKYKKEGICIVYSGGVDSTLLLKAAVMPSLKNTAHPS